MILLVDADSLAWSSCFKRKENPDDNPFYENIDEVTLKFDEVLMSIVNKLEEFYPVEEVRVFNNSKGNFRKQISKTYKANRKPIDIPPLLNEVHRFIGKEYNGQSGYGYETDDLVASTWYKLSQEVGRDNVMIVSIDKDYKQFPCLMYDYNYRKQIVYDINERDAMYNFYEQMIVGDTADNVNFCKGYGQKYAQKLLGDAQTHYQFSKRVYNLFKEIHKQKARMKYIECYTLLKLKTDVI